MSRPILPILTLKLVAVATFLEPSEKWVNWQSMIKCLPYGENLVKIGAVVQKFVF